MYSYVTKELPAIVTKNFNVTNQASIMGHRLGHSPDLDVKTSRGESGHAVLVEHADISDNVSLRNCENVDFMSHCPNDGEIY